MIVDPETAARAKKLIAQWMQASVCRREEQREIPLASVRGLHPRNHYDVNEWGETIAETLLRAGRQSSFTIRIDGPRIFARTDAAFDDVALAACANAERFIRELAPLEVTLDKALVSRATELSLAAAK